MERKRPQGLWITAAIYLVTAGLAVMLALTQQRLVPEYETLKSHMPSIIPVTLAFAAVLGAMVVGLILLQPWAWRGMIYLGALVVLLDAALLVYRLNGVPVILPLAIHAYALGCLLQPEVKRLFRGEKRQRAQEVS